MIDKITYIESPTFSPYYNLAVEEYLLLHCENTECILYLWQNKHTIVIGQNQNAWKECNVSKLEEDGGYLVRRLSGGGAVFHDLGNLNFTFLVSKENYDVGKQTDVILRAVNKLGIHAEKSGRNDLHINGKKFSGNAYYETRNHCYHHGTLMVNVDKQMLSYYLTVSKEKLQSKGVDSAQSRVTNLIEYCPELTIDKLKDVLKESFEEVYGTTCRTITTDALDKGKLEKEKEKFSSWDWKFGKKLEFQNEISKKFDWGEIQIQFQVKSGTIKDVNIYSDSLKPDFIRTIAQYITGIRYKNSTIATELTLFWSPDKEEERMMNDVINWIREENL